jgi:hypothetical protein
MTEPIQRVRVFVLGRGDNPLAAPVDIVDPAILQALATLIDTDAITPQLTPSPTRILRAVLRTGVANLQRVLAKNLMQVSDDGKLIARHAKGLSQAIALQNRL